MSTIVPRGASAPLPYDARMLALIRRTVASDCSDDEFDVFIHTARRLGLDPLRRQVQAFVFNKNRPDRRHLSIITSIDGFRAIANRTGDYRPDEEEPTFDTKPSLRRATNPAGLVKATVRVHKFSHGAWHQITASAHWDEYAPITRAPDAVDDFAAAWAAPAVGKRSPRRRLDPRGNWAKMPRLMLAKVAEALALRKGWPDDFANVYASEEVECSRGEDVLPSQAALASAARERPGGVNTILIDWMDNQPLSGVPVAQFADRVMAYLTQQEGQATTIAAWAERNRHALREYWNRSPSDALELKQHIERATGASSAIERV